MNGDIVYRHVRLASGELAVIDTDTGEVIAADSELHQRGNYPTLVEIPWEPFTQAELNQPNPIMVAAYAVYVNSDGVTEEQMKYYRKLLAGGVIDIDDLPKPPRPQVKLPEGYDWHYDG